MARAGTIRDPTGRYPGRIIQVISNKLDPKTVVAVAYQAGFRGRQLLTAVAVSFAENGSHDATVQHVNSDKSVDTGLWQINSVHDISIRDLFDPQRNANAAYAISSHGSNFTPWTTYPTLSGIQMPLAQKTIIDLNNHGGAVEWLKNNPIGSSAPGSVNSPNLGDQIKNSTPIQQVTDALGSIGSGLSFLTDKHNYYRLGQILMGAALLLIGLYIIVKESPASTLVAT